jgi:hypothetical protein
MEAWSSNSWFLWSLVNSIFGKSNLMKLGSKNLIFFQSSESQTEPCILHSQEVLNPFVKEVLIAKFKPLDIVLQHLNSSILDHLQLKWLLDINDVGFYCELISHNHNHGGFDFFFKSIFL